MERIKEELKLIAGNWARETSFEWQMEIDEAALRAHAKETAEKDHALATERIKGVYGPRKEREVTAFNEYLAELQGRIDHPVKAAFRQRLLRSWSGLIAAVSILSSIFNHSLNPLLFLAFFMGSVLIFIYVKRIKNTRDLTSLKKSNFTERKISALDSQEQKELEAYSVQKLTAEYLQKNREVIFSGFKSSSDIIRQASANMSASAMNISILLNNFDVFHMGGRYLDSFNSLRDACRNMEVLLSNAGALVRAEEILAEIIRAASVVNFKVESLLPENVSGIIGKIQTEIIRREALGLQGQSLPVWQNQMNHIVQSEKLDSIRSSIEKGFDALFAETKSIQRSIQSAATSIMGEINASGARISASFQKITATLGSTLKAATDQNTAALAKVANDTSSLRRDTEKLRMETERLGKHLGVK